ncbi:putative adenylyltransferase/sulfurtransferase MoeZ [Pleomorphomonas sp. T1.2MG-36]|uniref:HesA/MoeB/ThiF family protein n=1 Tax=Pleomorphomonas sp. T1.2MG-36 TaxID=3041167 RepID=UPI002477CADA|nr:HesA/MoeB/ThiF family protein [Pleomorphomonas sp. T1.2MG-36]CAI9406194.1 putative adenylyltransferase/sulfurtransferase MoeZ [Pleomorphomonas sp. T1.2MG-36]
MTLSQDEVRRYSRHLLLRDVGGPGQQKLKAARVLCVGAGGLGSPIIEYLAAAGVGTLGLVDDDVVSLSNLQRQVVHSTANVGKPKVESAAERIAALNPHVTTELFPVRLDGDNVAGIVERFDVVVDGTDNFQTRFLVADAAYALQKPLVTAAVQEFYGSVTTLQPYLSGDDGRPLPSWRCLMPHEPQGDVPTCAQVGILGAVVGVLGTLAACEVLKLITGVGTPLIGRLLMVDIRDMRVDSIGYKRRPDTVPPTVKGGRAGADKAPMLASEP